MFSCTGKQAADNNDFLISVAETNVFTLAFFLNLYRYQVFRDRCMVHCSYLLTQIRMNNFLLLYLYPPGLTAQLQVADRPVTQQGLGGPKTAGTRGRPLLTFSLRNNEFRIFIITGWIQEGCLRLLNFIDLIT